MSKNLEDYSKSDLKAWIDTLNIATGAKNKAKKVIEDYNHDGLGLVDVESKDDLNDFGFPKFVCQKLFTALKLIPRSNNGNSNNNKLIPRSNNGNSNNNNNDNEEKAQDADANLRRLYEQQQQRQRNRQQKRQQQQQNIGNPTQNRNNNLEYFKVKYSYGHINRSTVVYFTERNYVRDVETAIIDSEVGGNKQSIELILKGKVLQSGQMLRQVGLTKQTSAYLQVTVSFKTNGGASLSSDEKSEYYQNENRTRFPNFEGEKRIKPTLDPDCIMGYDSQKTLRVKMPCGHVFDPITLFRIAKMTMENHSKTEFICPIEKCETWPFEVVAAAADMNDSECINFSKILSNRKAIETGEFKQCKGCQSLVKKPDNLRMKRVRCSNRKNCKLGDFCWLCGDSWKGGGFISCGNNNCQSNKINESLTAAPMITPSGREDAKCPNLRACPRCWVLIRYRSACKHMSCWNCRKKFCFMCLSLQKDDLTWDCVGGDWYRGKCPAAGVQKLK